MWGETVKYAGAVEHTGWVYQTLVSAARKSLECCTWIIEICRSLHFALIVHALG
jgi:hypothetical protein